MTKLFLIAATLLSAASSPVIARDLRPAAAPVDATIGAPARAASPTTRYCVIDVPTGSHIQHKTCMTRQEWIDRTGQDPLAKD